MAKGIYVGAAMPSRIVEGDIIPKTWTEVVVGTKYVAEDGTELSASSYSGTQYANKACDVLGADSSWSSNVDLRPTSAWLQLKLTEPIKITKIKLYMDYNSNHVSFVKIQGSNNGTDWQDLHNYVKEYTGYEEVTLNSPMYAQYYRIYSEFEKDYNIRVDDWQTLEYELPEKQNIARKVKKAYVGAETPIYETAIFSNNPAPTSWTKGEDGLSATAVNSYGTWTLTSTKKTRITDTNLGQIADGSESTGWQFDKFSSNNEVAYIYLTPPASVEIKPTKIYIYHTLCGNANNLSKVQGLYGDTWINLGTLSSVMNGARENFSISENIFFTKFRLEIYPYSSSDYYANIVEFEIKNGEIRKNTNEIKNLARRIKKGYIGVSGIARPFYSAEPELNYYGVVEDLSRARYRLKATAVGNYALFGGGNTSATSSAPDVDAYDTTLVRTTPAKLSSRAYNLAATRVGDYALFAGGQTSSSGKLDTVDTYNTSLVKGTATDLSTARASLAATTVGDYALFGGGQTSGYVATVDAYNTSLSRSTPSVLTKKRYDLAATSVGNYALFGGGYSSGDCVATVDTYNNTLVKGTATDLSVDRRDLVATSVGDYAVFGGGKTDDGYSAVVDTYNSSLVKGNSVDLSVARTALTATSMGNYALFAGGYDGSNYISVVDVYDSSLAKETVGNLAAARGDLTSATVGDYALFAGGTNGSNFATVEVYKLVE
jgi:uncharacterized protein YeeX (DUF496 family)